MRLLWSFLAVLAIASARSLGRDRGEELASLTLLKQAAVEKGAVCLDGSAPGYYFRPGQESGSNKWILYMQGGGWCYDGVEDCYNRSHSGLGSSTSWTSTHTFEGALSPDRQVNPAFYNWNMVHLQYCDGGSFSASKEEPDVYKDRKLYYRGYRILTAIIEDLDNNRNLRQATDVVLAGSSAGGLAVYLHMNYVQTLIPPTARFSGLPDAGFFIDIHSYNSTFRTSSYIPNMIKFQGIDEGLMPECKENNPGDSLWHCMSAPHIYEYIKAPALVLNSRYDKAQLSGFSLPCLPPDCNDKEMEFFNYFGTAFLDQVGVVINSNKSGDGYFLDSCVVHSQSINDHIWSKYSVNGVAVSQAVYNWYHNSATVKYRDCDYPCNPSCPQSTPQQIFL